MFSAFIVYFTILIVFVVFSRFQRVTSNKFLSIVCGYFIPILIVCVFLGGRYEVGTDWENYREYFEVINKYSIKNVLSGPLEPLYVLLNKVVSMLGLGLSALFAIIAFIEFSIVYVLFKEEKSIIPYALFFYTITNLSLDINIVRQTLAMSFVFLASRYVNVNKLKCALLIATAIGFHYSAVVSIPIILIDKKIFKFLDKTSLVIVLYFIALIFATIIRQYLSYYVQMIDFGDKYNNNAAGLDQEMRVSTGYGLIAKHVLNVMLLFLWSKVRHYVNNPYYDNVYRITVLGFILANICSISVYLSRVSLYYSQFFFIIWAVTSYIVYHNKKVKQYNVFVYGAIVLYLMMFAASIYHSDGGISPYTFGWIS